MENSDSNVLPPIVIGFWRWLVYRDPQGDRGAANILNRWLLLHLLIACALALSTAASAGDIARSIALPGAAILVGLAFAWAGRSANLLQDKAFSKFLIENGPPVEGYVYSFQLAILTVILFVITALAVFATGLGISLGSDWADDTANKFLIFFSGSIALRECWGVILFVNKLTIQYYKIRERELAEFTEDVE